MKLCIYNIGLGAALGLSTLAYADATVQLNNYSALMPVYYKSIGNLAFGDDFYIEVMAGPLGTGSGALVPIIPVGATGPIIKLKEPGYFDAGIGVIPYVPDNWPAEFSVRGWYGSPDYYSADQFGRAGFLIQWSQLTGSWDPNSGLTPTGPVLGIRAPLVIGLPIPEPSTVALGILGVGLLLGGAIKKRGSDEHFDIEGGQSEHDLKVTTIR